jgi:quinoprotein glucose dehydrogenase
MQVYKSYIFFFFFAASAASLYFFETKHDNYSELPDSSWERSGHSNSSDKYSPLSQINKKNVTNLKVAWTNHSGQDGSILSIQSSPIFADKEGLLITPSPCCLLGISAVTGKEIWRLELPGPVARRGLVYKEGTIFAPTSKGIYAITAKTGKINENLGAKGIFGSELSVLPPVVDGEQLIFANFAHLIESYNIKSGKKLWSTSLAKSDIYPRLWSGISYDEKNKLVFVVTSNSMGLLRGNNAKDDYASSVIGINAKNGKIIWQFQEIKDERWDLDLVGAPNLFNIKINGTLTPALVAVSKTGNIIFLNRLNGKSIFGFNYKDAPMSLIPGEIASKKQIVISKPEAFSSLIFNIPEDVTDSTSEKHDYVLHKLRNARSGWLVPVSLTYDVVMFGLNGGAEWPGSAIDPENSVLVVPSNKIPFIIRSAYTDRKPEISSAIAKKNNVYLSKCSSCHGENLGGMIQTEGSDFFNPSLIGITKKRSEGYLKSLDIFNVNHKYANKHNSSEISINLISQSDLLSTFRLFKSIDSNIENRNDFEIKTNWQSLLDPDGQFGSKPPWGYISATDLKTGLMKWKVPVGDIFDKSSNKKFIGDSQFGGVVITKGGIVFATGTKDKKAIALDINNGSILWKSQLPASGSAPPITYNYGGCQFVLFTATGGGRFGNYSDSIVAYKLSDCTIK